MCLRSVSEVQISADEHQSGTYFNRTYRLRRYTPFKDLVTLISTFLLCFSLSQSQAATPGLPFTEDFSDTNLKSSNTTANWSTNHQLLRQSNRQRRHGLIYGLSGPVSDSARNYNSDAFSSFDLAIGDLDNNGLNDIVVANWNDPNRIYYNSDVFSGGPTTSQDLSPLVSRTFEVDIADMDGDGDLDIIAGNQGHQTTYF